MVYLQHGSVYYYMVERNVNVIPCIATFSWKIKQSSDA